MNTAAPAHTLRNLPECVIGGGFVFTILQGAGSSSHGARSRGTDRRYRARYRSSRLSRGDDWRSSCSSGLRRVQGRIKQQGVLTQQTTTRPQHLNQEVQIRLTHRLIRGYANDTLAIRFEYRCKFQVGQKVLAINASLDEFFRRSQVRQYFIGSQITHFQQLDFSHQWLIQRRLQGYFTQPPRMRHTGGQC